MEKVKKKGASGTDHQKPAPRPKGRKDGLRKHKQAIRPEERKDGLARKRRAIRPLIHSYDIIGDIAIIEVPEGRQKQKKEIAESIIATHPRIKTVLEKKSDREGEYRLRRLSPIIGKDTITEHKESGCRFRLDVRKSYFSPREGTDRERIASKVRPKETVLVMFAGIGPYAIVIGKKQPKVRKIFAVEINPNAVKWMKENVRLNKLSYVVEPLLGECRQACKQYYGKCNRVIMPLPHEGHQFLETAIRCLKPDGIIHFYFIGPQDTVFRQAADIIRKECRKLRRECRILEQRKVLPYGPCMYKTCTEFRVH